MNDNARSIPLPARWLGFGGLLPFVLLALATVADSAQATRWSFALLAYGAVILSFVGALHWGFATVWQAQPATFRGRLMAGSVVPALGAWVALLMPTAIGMALLCLLFVTHYLCDMKLTRRCELPDWYLRLRLPLTVGAVACLTSAALAL